MKKFLITIALLMNYANGQTDSIAYQGTAPQYIYWLNIGAGIDSYSSAFNLGVNYNFILDGNFYQVGYQSISRKPPEIYSGLEYKELSFYACNIGIGQVGVKDFLFWANFIGPAYIWGEKVGDDFDANGIRQIKEFYSVGVALNSQIFFRPINELGVGLEMYGNINPVRTLAEVRLSIHFNNGML